MTLTNALDRTHLSNGLVQEYEAFATLVESLDAAAWVTPSRCEGFDVRDVAGHVIGLAEDVAAGTPGSRNAEEEAASVRGDTPARAAQRLRTALVPISSLLEGADDAMWATPVVNDLTLGEGVLLLWYDAFVHGDDIRAALGRPSERGIGLGASVTYVAGQLVERRWGPATLEMEGFEPVAIGTGGPTIQADALQFVLAATGRADPTPLGLDETVNIYAE